MADQFVKVKLGLYAEIKTQSGVVKFDDIVSMSATFGLNSIPTASMVVAVGEDPRRNKIATIHKQKSKLRPRDQVKIFVKMIPQSGATEKVPGQRYKVFEGYLSGIGYQRSHNSANFVINVVHWIDDLNNSGALTGNWMPGSAYDMAQAAVYNNLVPGGGLGLGTAQVDPRYSIVTIDNASTDLWERVIKPIYVELAQWAYGRQQDVPANGQAIGTNSAAIGIGDGVLKPGALNRMPGDDGKKYYKPIGLELNGLGMETQDSIRLALQMSNSRSFAYTTFWGKLVGEAAPQFFFAVSPAVDWALPIPFFAALKKEWITVKADEYSYANFNANMSQLIECVDVFYPAGANPMSTAGMGGTDPQGQERPLGYFPEKPIKRGLKLYKEPPAWLSNVVPWQQMSPGSTGEGGPVPGDMAFPNSGAPFSIVDPPGALINKLKSSGVATKLAEHWYKSELLYQRYGEMSGMLRFDIAPGSIVKIETPPRDVKWYYAKEPYMFATVTQVSFAINAERAMAGTSFSLAHIRTAEENDDSQITAEKPPLFKQEWSGSPLADPDPQDWPGWAPKT